MSTERAAADRARAEVQAAVLALADEWCQDIDADFRACGTKLRDALPDTAALDRMLAEARAEGVSEFVQWVATNAAYNGAPDRGQTFYNECLNQWLPEQAERFRAEREGAT